jgi:hypothetical protein
MRSLPEFIASKETCDVVMDSNFFKGLWPFQDADLLAAGVE